MVPQEGRARWADATIVAVQVVGPNLTVYELSREVPSDASGGPLLGSDGAVLGVVTVAETDEGLAPLGVPWRYLEPLLHQQQSMPLSVLKVDAPRRPAREIPEHPLSLLDGSSLSGLQATVAGLTAAIREGAPAYNDGDIDRCVRVYQAAARGLLSTRDDCPGVQRALAAGLARAEAASDVDARAWALRDAFDGLLIVIDKLLSARLGAAHRPGKPTLLN
jgi:hypothetical protein